MNSDKFIFDRHKPPVTEERAECRFEQYETDPANHPSVNPPFPQNREQYEIYNRLETQAADARHLDQLASSAAAHAAAARFCRLDVYCHGVCFYDHRVDDLGL